MLTADTYHLRSGSGGLERAGATAQDASEAMRAAGRTAAGAAGDGPVGPAVDRFVAAAGGDLLAWGLDSATLAMVASENAAQMTAATGGP